MPGPDSRLRTNDAECAAKVLDGEAVIINLLNGTYYSLDKAGAVMWELAASGGTIAEIVGGVTARYDVDASRAEADVKRLVDELLAERLLVPADGASVGPATSESSGSSTGARSSYDAPTLTTYRDMADLLAVDPPMPRLEDIVWEEPGGASTPKR
jgi:hypothetical protein